MQPSVSKTPTVLVRKVPMFMTYFHLFRSTSNFQKKVARSLFRKMSSDITTVDYLVLGAGSGGIASARRATEFGITSAIIEHGPLGGTCVSFF